MKVTVLYFAKLRQAASQSKEEFELPNGTTVADLYQQISEKYDGILDPSLVAYAVNETYAQENTVLKAGDTVSFIPPVAGG